MYWNTNGEKDDSRAIREVTCVCDECGSMRLARAFEVEKGRKARDKDIDLCISCSHLGKYRTPKLGENHWNFKHDLQSGYRRITVYDENKIPRRVAVHVLKMEESISRRISRGEIVHHIDMNKLNNQIENLHLFPSRAAHALCHYSLENCGYSLLGKHIWFDWEQKKYVLKQTQHATRIMTDEMQALIVPKFDFPRKKNAHRRRQRKGRQGNLHGMIIELEIGRRLYANECIHHVNGIPDDNDINNLCLIGRSEHRKAHYSLQLCVVHYLNTLIYFENGIYKVR